MLARDRRRQLYDAFLEKLVPAVGALKVGDPSGYGVDVGPVVNPRPPRRSSATPIRAEQRGGCWRAESERPARGYFVEPTVVADVAPDARIAQEEIFGPYLAVIKARDFDHALEIANGTEFGLTGAVFSSSEERLAQAEREFFVGNLYLNRKCTGALVGGQPFGGFNMSGTDSKAGGYDYLLLFLQGQSVSRKIAAQAADDLAAGMD